MRKCRGENALPPADHVMHNLVDFAAEQRCDVILYSMNDHDAVEEIIFLRSEPPTQRPRGGDDTLRQNAVLVYDSFEHWEEMAARRNPLLATLFPRG